MADDLGERTEEATPKRRSEAREEGNVAKSADLSAAIVLLVMILALWAAAMPMLGRGRAVLWQSLDPVALGNPAFTESALDGARYLAIAAALIVAPLLLIGFAAAYLSNFMQVGWLFAPKAARPTFRKLNPLSGIKRILGLSGLVKSSLDVVKVAIVIVIAALTIAAYADRIIVLPYLSALQSAREVAIMMLDLALRIIGFLLLLGVIDFAYQRWKHNRDLRMTKQQVKDELKQSEGDPEVKRRRIRMQRQIALQRINAAVPKADVVVTNPEHVAVAIQYDAARMNAPKVVAKGADYLAMRIRLIAVQHGIPIVERPPLARALYKEVAVNQEVPPAFYKAVAEILAYVYRLAGRAPTAAAGAR